MKNPRFAILILVALTVGLSACSRKAKESSKIRLAFGGSSQGKAGALGAPAGYNPAHLIINVRGPAVSGVIQWHWDSHDCPTETCSPPQEIALDVPKGDSTLVQALVVYDNDSDQMQFYYDDASVNLGAGETAVSLSPVSVGASSTQGYVSGRFMNGAPSGGPSGFLETRFAPPNAKPEMIVMGSMMFAGWFNLFVLDGSTRFNYFLNGQPLLLDMHLNSPQFAGSPAVFRAQVPSGDRERDGGWQTEPAYQMIVGFFGPAVPGSYRSCYDSRASIPVQGLYIPTTSTPINWEGGSPTSADAGPIAGGLGYDPTGSGSVCHDDNQDYNSTIHFDVKSLRNGHDSVAGFRGPFRGKATPYGVDFVSAANNGAGTYSMDWSFLPGVLDGDLPIHGVTPFVLAVNAPPPPDNKIRGDSGIRCSALMANHFLPMWGDIPTTPGVYDYSVDITNVPETKLVLCPYTGDGPSRIYHDAGVEVYSHGVTESLNIKLVGSDLSNTLTWTPGLGAGDYTFLKSAILNSYHNFIIKKGSQNIQASDVLGAWATVDDGANWTSINIIDIGFSGGAQTVASAPIVSTGGAPATDLYNLINANGAANDVVLRLKVQVDPTYAANNGLYEDVVETGDLTLVGTTACPSPGTLLLLNLASDTPVTADTGMDPFLSANGTDVEVTYGLHWSGCTGQRVMAPIDYISLSNGSVSPAQCFDLKDITDNPAYPLGMRISPLDSMGVDCDLGATFSVGYHAPSNAGTDAIYDDYTSGTIQHSSVANKITGLAMIDDQISNSISSLRFYYQMAIVGPSQNVKLNALYLNSDGKAVSEGPTPTPAVPSSVTWMLNPAHWTAPAGVIPNLLDTTSISPPSPFPVENMAMTDGTATGGIYSLVKSTTETVLAVSENPLDGGSPVSLVDDGTDLYLAHIPSSYGNFANKPLMRFELPTDIASGTGPAFAKVFVINQNGQSFIFVALEYTADHTAYYYGAYEGHGTSATINWAGSYSLANEHIYDIVISKQAATPFIHKMSDYGGNGTNTGTFPTYSAGSFSGTVFFPSYYGLNGPIAGDPIGYARCGDELFAVGAADNTNYYFAAKKIDDSAGGWASGPITYGNTVSVQNHKRVRCMYLGAAGPGAQRAFLTFDPSDGTLATNHKIHPFEGNSSTCGTSNAALAGGGLSSNGMSFTASTGGIQDAIPAFISGQQGFLFTYENATYPTKISFVQLSSCTSGVLTFSPPVQYGSMASPATVLNRMVNLGSGFGGGSPDQVTAIGLFGGNSQFYQLGVR